MYTKNKGENPRKTIKRKPTAPPVWARDPGPGPGLPGPRPWGCCRLAFYCFSLVFLCFWYAYAIIGFEINIRLDLIPNVYIIIPNPATAKNVDTSRFWTGKPKSCNIYIYHFHISESPHLVFFNFLGVGGIN